MISKLRIIFNDTLTGESDHIDALTPVEFNGPSVIKVIGDYMTEGAEDESSNLELVSWVVDGYGGTACFILRWDSYLIHGVCYTRFVESHNPFR